MSVQAAAAVTLTLIETGLHSGRISVRHPGRGWESVEEILQGVIDGGIVGAMAHRNLGWAQCAIYVAGGATVEELADINVQYLGEEYQ